MKMAAPQISLLAPLLDKKRLLPVTESRIKTPKGVMCEHILINFVCFTTGASIWREGSVKLQPTPIHHTALHEMARCIYLYIACRDKNVHFFLMYRPTLAMKNGSPSDKCEGCQRLSEIKMSTSSCFRLSQDGSLKFRCEQSIAERGPAEWREAADPCWIMCRLHLELSYHSSLILHRNISATFKMLIIVRRISQCFIIINTDDILTKARVFGEYFACLLL